MKPRAIFCIITDALQKLKDSIFHSEGGGSRFLWNVGAINQSACPLGPQCPS